MPEVMLGGGLISRIVFVYGAAKRHLAAYPGDLVDREKADALKATLVEDLNKIADLKGQYALDAEAKEWGNPWYKKLWEERPLHLASERFDAYVSRKQTHVHKLAMVLAAAQRDELVITMDDLQTANRFLTALEGDMQLVFQSIGVSDTSRYTQELLTFVRAYKRIDQRTLWRLCMTTMGPREFSEAIESAVRAGYLTVRGEGTDMMYQAVKEEKE